jgi:MFS family permease
MTQTATPTLPPRAPARTGWILAVILLGQFMAMLDASIVNVAAPTIRAELHTSGAGLQLVVAGYIISYAVLLITGARLGDLAGHGRMFQAGLALFTLTSLACGLAPGSGALIAFRFAQGAGAALLVPQVFSLIQRTFAGPARARALSFYAAIIAAGGIVGQVLGGLLVDANLVGSGWRPVFLVNVPVGVVLLAMGRRLLPHDRGEPGRRLDPVGTLVLAAAVFALVLPLVLGHEYDWPLWTWLSLAGSLALFGAFAVLQRRTAGVALISARVLRAPGLPAAAVAILLAMASYAGYMFATAVHLQNGLGYSPTRAGLAFTPGALAFAVGSLNWRRVPASRWRRMIPLGLVVAAAGDFGIAWSLHGGRSAGVGFAASIALFGLGLGVAFSPLITVALTHVPVGDAADASGVLATLAQLGQVIGVATFGSLYLTLVTGHGSGASIGVTACAFAGCALLAAVAALFLPSLSRAATAG